MFTNLPVFQTLVLGGVQVPWAGEAAGPLQPLHTHRRVISGATKGSESDSYPDTRRASLNAAAPGRTRPRWPPQAHSAAWAPPRESFLCVSAGSHAAGAAGLPGGGSSSMKIKRQKHAKKTLGFYRCSFGLRQPFQVLLCGTFCQAALRGQIQLKEQLPKYLQGEVTLCTTSCVLKELESLGKELYGAKLIAQRFQVRHCAHFKNPVGGSECLLSMIADGNPHHYFVATQDQELADKIKKRAGVPLLFIIQNTIVLDKPSPKSLAFIQAVQTSQLVPVHQKKSIDVLKEEKGIVMDSNHRGKKRKRTSGPNPLSCMKKKKKGSTPATPATTAAGKKKRKRKRTKSGGNPAPALPLKTAVEG